MRAAQALFGRIGWLAPQRLREEAAGGPLPRGDDPHAACRPRPDGLPGGTLQ
jgi:hypothetical protein